MGMFWVSRVSDDRRGRPRNSRDVQVDDTQELYGTCRPGEHKWRVVDTEPLSGKVCYRCVRCDSKKTETRRQPRRRKPPRGRQRRKVRAEKEESRRH